MKRPTNNTHGQIHVVLDTSDAGDSYTGKKMDLKVWIGGCTIGNADGPLVWLTVNDARDRHKRTTDGEDDCMFCVSIERLRNLCDMIEAMHKVGNDQFKHMEGADSES